MRRSTGPYSVFQLVLSEIDVGSEVFLASVIRPWFRAVDTPLQNTYDPVSKITKGFTSMKTLFYSQ